MEKRENYTEHFWRWVEEKIKVKYHFREEWRRGEKLQNITRDEWRRGEKLQNISGDEWMRGENHRHY